MLIFIKDKLEVSTLIIFLFTQGRIYVSYIKFSDGQAVKDAEKVELARIKCLDC